MRPNRSADPDVRRTLVVIASRVALAAGAMLVLALLGVAANPQLGTLLAGGVVAAFVLAALTSLMLDRERAIIGRSARVSLAASALQALVFSLVISVMLFVYVVPATFLLSGLVILNLFGLLFWRFRRRYADAADDAAAGAAEDDDTHDGLDAGD